MNEKLDHLLDFLSNNFYMTDTIEYQSIVYLKAYSIESNSGISVHIGSDYNYHVEFWISESLSSISSEPTRFFLRLGNKETFEGFLDKIKDLKIKKLFLHNLDLFT